MHGAWCMSIVYMFTDFRQEDKNSKVILIYRESLKLAWAARYSKNR